MVWIFRSRILRRPVTLMGAACTSMLVGVIIFNKIFTSSNVCNAASCNSGRYPSYEYLQKNEASRKVKHPFVKSFDVNFLGSNSPIEDRFVVGTSSNLGAALFSVIDGHKGTHCSHYLQKHLLQHVSSHLHTLLKNGRKNDLTVLMDMNSTVGGDYTVNELETHPFAVLESDVVHECLKQSYVTLDNDISNTGLQALKSIMKGHSFSDDIKKHIKTAIEGACVITALVTAQEVYVANTGDCRVVLGQKLPNNTWRAVPLSIDQNAQNPSEVERLFQAHPGEEDTVIVGNRVLGSLMPFRTFGDVDFKWEEKYLSGVIIHVWPNYRTPPYITAEPVITEHKVQGTDKFLILASDGLWERMSNEEAVNIVAECIKTRRTIKSSSIFNFFSRKTSSSERECCNEVENEANAATKLLWYALGGTEESVSKLLNISPRYSRMFRDDITALVVFFEDDV